MDIVKFYYEFIQNNEFGHNYSDFLLCFCPNKITPFHVACKRNQKKVIDYFFTQNLAAIQNSFNINLAPLEYAYRYGSLDCVKILINHENNLNISNYQIEKTFKRALIGGHLDIIQFLLKTKKS